jgi:hypothetical protein
MFKTAQYVVFSLILFFIVSIANADDIRILSYQCRRDKFIWTVSEQKLATWPKWNIDKESIPLQPEKAYRIARQWITKKYPSPVLTKITLLSLYPEDKEFKGRYVYVIDFITGTFDSMVAVVLLNGKVLEPEGGWPERK